MHKLTRYKWGLFRHFCESFPNAYYDVPGLIKDANGAWLKAADVEQVFKETATVLDACIVKLKLYREHSSGEYQGGMEHMALITEAVRLLARIESAK